ncbi:MAG: hypothetical protein WAM60_26735 [Candidatus Promineifilaceae bacterium]
MSAIASKSLDSRSSLLRTVVLGGTILFFLQTIIQEWLYYYVIQKTPFAILWQYIASGILGDAAFTGGTATVLLGMFFHLIICLVIAGVFILSANRIPLLRRYPIPGSLLYGFGVFIVMNFIVTPLSATPPLPAPTMPQLIEVVLEHILVVGLSLGLFVRLNAQADV